MAEKTRYENGQVDYTHKKLVRATGMLNRLIKSGHLFTYLTYLLENPGVNIPSCTNYIEGAINKSLRKIWATHCGMSLIHRLKAGMWWLYMHSEQPLGPKEILECFVTDDEVAGKFSHLTTEDLLVGSPVRWGDGLVWEELHRKDRYLSFYED